MRQITILARICMSVTLLMILALQTNAQDSRSRNVSPSILSGANYIADYERSAKGIQSLLNHFADDEYNHVLSALQDLYSHTRKDEITEGDLFDMMIPSQDNFNLWLDLRENLDDVQFTEKPNANAAGHNHRGYSKDVLLQLISSILLNIKTRI